MFRGHSWLQEWVVTNILQGEAAANQKISPQRPLRAQRKNGSLKSEINHKGHEGTPREAGTLDKSSFQNVNNLFSGKMSALAMPWLVGTGEPQENPCLPWCSFVSFVVNLKIQPLTYIRPSINFALQSVIHERFK
jgi:hypothetical protein